MTDSPVPLAAHHHPDLSIDQQLALRTASTRLHDDFSEHFGVETIERFLHSSYDQFAGRATVPNFLPLLAERWARQRLTALARVEGKITDAKPTVLFLCTHNAGRSQMALGYFNHLAGDQGVAWSGGSEPGNEINPSAIQAMAEVDIDITREFPKPWTDEIVQAADVVVTMGCGDACPFFPGKRYENWELARQLDPVRGIGGQMLGPHREPQHLVLMLGYCGLRFGEAAALRCADVNCKTRRIRVSRSVTYVTRKGLVEGDTKNHTTRSVPVPRFLAPLLDTELAGKDGDGLVFPSRRGGYLTESELRWVFDPAATAIGAEGLTPHELRHTCASLAIAGGANVKVLQTLLGHKTATLTLDRYGHLFPDDLDRIADAFDAAAENAADWLRTGPSLRAVPSDGDRQ